MPPRILLTHPGRQHSHQAALGLERAGLLAGYWAGVPPGAGSHLGLPAAFWRRVLRYAPLDLPGARCRAFPGTPAMRRLGDRLLPGGAASWVDFHACRRFDRQVARRLGRVAANAVIANEISALLTFRAAGRRGWRAILDAPSFHPAAQDRLHGTTDSARLHRAIRRVKDGEIAAADHILCVSELARQTYLDAGSPVDKVHALALGADLELFQPASGVGPASQAPAGDPAPPPGALRFLFAGAPIERKGFDLLLTAYAEARRAGAACELRLVGPRPATLPDLPGLTSAGSLAQSGLARELRAAHCLVLPSRNDSFGMVVPEALASGIPVIVSDMVGAKDLVAPERTGWIVPHGDASALAAVMITCARRPGALRAMAAECRRAAEGATWESYHRRLADLLRDLLH